MPDGHSAQCGLSMLPTVGNFTSTAAVFWIKATHFARILGYRGAGQYMEQGIQTHYVIKEKDKDRSQQALDTTGYASAVLHYKGNVHQKPSFEL